MARNADSKPERGTKRRRFCLYDVVLAKGTRTVEEFTEVAQAAAEIGDTTLADFYSKNSQKFPHLGRVKLTSPKWTVSENLSVWERLK